MAVNNIGTTNLQRRCAAVRRLLKPILAGADVSAVAVPQVQRWPETVVVTAWHARSGETYREWLFRTKCKAIWGQYFEEWATAGSQRGDNSWLLSQACLHLFHVPGPTVREEIFALHCKPGQIGGGYQATLRRGPHVHVRVDSNRLSHIHIPLNLGHLEGVLASCDALTSALQKSIDFVAFEIVEASLKNALFT